MAGKVDVPNVICPKELIDEEIGKGMKVIPLIVKKPSSAAI